MRVVQSNITVLDKILALNLNISLWTARRKMTSEDFGGVELPPGDLATLGSKRIADPEKLRIFNTLKARAFCFLGKHGVRFMSGWAIPESKAGMITGELDNIRREFFNAKDSFLAEYDDNLNAWLDKHADWAGIIRDSVVSSDYVRSRLDFRWQLYKVAPLMRHEDKNAVLKAGLAEEVQGLASTLLAEVAQNADEMWKKIYMGKTEVTHKALSPLRTLRDKLLGLTFIEPHVAPIAELIETTLKQMPEKGSIADANLVMLQGLVCLLRDSDSLLLHSQKLLEGIKASDVLDGFGNVTNEAPIFLEDNAKKIMPDVSQLASIPAKPVLPNMGLW